LTNQIALFYPAMYVCLFLFLLLLLLFSLTLKSLHYIMSVRWVLNWSNLVWAWPAYFQSRNLVSQVKSESGVTKIFYCIQEYDH